MIEVEAVDANTDSEIYASIAEMSYNIAMTRSD